VSLVPPHLRGQKIGLLGGSFNPPHAAHRAISLIALKRLQLDHVWWLVTPGNPLKDSRDLLPLQHRLAAARALAQHPRITATGFEAEIGTRFTIDAIAWLQAHCVGVRFVWLMGADNLRQFHHWKNWRGIAARLPIAVIDRGGLGLDHLSGPFARAFAHDRLREADATRLARRRPPVWVYLHGPRSALSSTALRAQNVKTPLKLS
jgi:nicotinate-nucleotide adenylyltransferase